MTLSGRSIATVVPAHDEARWIGEVIGTMPSWVDAIVVVDDGSSDATAEAATARGDDRVTVIRHSSRRGVGAAILTGYRHALERGADAVAVMAGDGQMDPSDLARVVRPVAHGDADYVKGNRLRHAESRRMPAVRAAGSAVFGVLTSWATGVRIGDSQCGFTAISRNALAKLDLDVLWDGYGYPNDLLGAIAHADLRIHEVPVRPVYRGAASGLRPRHAAVILFLIGRVAWRRARKRVTGARAPWRPGAAGFPTRP
jgi:glycosyltransferase involved in cell wall biosynthesis